MKRERNAGSLHSCELEDTLMFASVVMLASSVRPLVIFRVTVTAGHSHKLPMI